ncbi:MAG TPA: pitrilysin family protein [Steroidobacteraceae bacterium]|nr:pitrilysin family protein [Steroidobacteraceae bacterium]
MKRFCCGCLLLLLAVCAHAAPASNPRVDFNQTILPNGLKVLFVEDHSAPVIAVSVVYDVGSRNEREGLTGFAHLFEHMMFKGSQNVGDGEHFFQVFSNGGTMNGSTNADVTLYYETLPANQLELALFLEGDRMRSLAITQEKLDNQRQAVQEERRLRLDNQPYGKADERFGELMYDNFAYKHSVIGSMADLNAASVADVAKFFKTYYAPNNAVLSVVGDFKRGTAEQLVRKYFASIPWQPAPPAVDLSEPEQKAERRETMVDPLARMAQVQIGYKTGTGNEPDQDALQILSTVLQGGNSSRLYQKLTKEKELVVDVGGFVDRRIGPSALLIGATVRPGRKVEDVEAVIYAEIDNLQQHPISAAELDKAKTASRLSYLQQIRSSQTRAILLGTYAVKFKDPNLVNTRLDRINAVTAADVQQVAQRYLQAKNRTVVIAKPVGG